ncbi:MAG: GntR family transcriptional regulator [Lentisphaeria bacterium]|nr:GntR family transcriptional regulator [Lentisphaeria bacterium]
MRNAEYLKIFDDLRNGIRSGMLAVGETLPSESRLAEQYNCSRPTVRKAISALAEEGLVNRCPGFGSTVTLPAGRGGRRPLTVAIDLAGINSATSYLGKLLQAVSDALQQEKGILRLLHTEEIPRVGRNDVDGVIITSGELYDASPEVLHLAGEGIPVLVMNRFPRQPELSYLAVDYRAESFKLVRRLLKNGARRIGLYGRSSTRPIGAARCDGWREAHEAEKVPVPENLAFFRSSFRPETGPEGLAQALRGEKIEVLYVLHGSDLPDAVRMVSVSGRPSPEIICFDDVEEFCGESDLPISYIRMPLQKMGRMAVQYFEERRLDRSIPPLRRQFEAGVVVNHCRYLI